MCEIINFTFWLNHFFLLTAHCVAVNPRVVQLTVAVMLLTLALFFDGVAILRFDKDNIVNCSCLDTRLIRTLIARVIPYRKICLSFLTIPGSCVGVWVCVGFLLLFLLSLFTVDQRRSCRFYNFRRLPCVVRCQWQALVMLSVVFCFISNRSNNCACAHLLFSLRLAFLSFPYPKNLWHMFGRLFEGIFY